MSVSFRVTAHPIPQGNAAEKSGKSISEGDTAGGAFAGSAYGGRAALQRREKIPKD
jgi:hypothetical protein